MGDFYDDPTHAVVIGGSIAGLMAARVLTDHFDTVTIIERDRLPQGPELRNGAPHARHAHALLAHGQELMEQLFPGLVAELTEAGAPDLRWGLNSAYLTPGGWVRYHDMGITTKLASRALVEWTMRRRLLAEYPVEILEATQVNGLLVSEGKQRVTGLRIQSRNGRHAERELSADFVIDASGRGSRAPEWLEAMGFARPEETTVNSYLAYATRWYERPADPPPWKAMYVFPRVPHVPRGGALFETEDNRWVVTLFGMKDHHPPTDPEGFLAFSKSIATPEFYNAIKNAKPVSDIHGYQRTMSRLRHYERLDRMPRRFVVLGDAAVAFNPIYGQGMTTAAIEVVALQNWLREQGQDASPINFQKRLFNAVQTAWIMSTGEDLRYPTTEGKRPNLATRLLQKYFDQVLKLAPSDAEAARAFVEVINLSASPVVLLRPGVIWKVARRLLSGTRYEEPPMPEPLRWHNSQPARQPQRLITGEMRVLA